MEHPLLEPHRVIAWDMDGTLINGPNSEFFRAYILAHPEKEHHIVTFRTGEHPSGRSWSDNAVHELFEHGVKLDAIQATHGIPVDLFLKMPRNDYVVLPKACEESVYWKAAKAREIGATVLVDDLISWAKPGCEVHGVAFVDANDETFMDVD